MFELYEDKFNNLIEDEILEITIIKPDYKALVDLAQIYLCRFLTPIILDNNSIIARFKN